MRHRSKSIPSVLLTIAFVLTAMVPAAFAAYTGFTTSSYIKGYTVTADYTGEVSRINLNRVHYVVIFEGEAFPSERAENSTVPSMDNDAAQTVPAETSRAQCAVDPGNFCFG